MDLRPDLAPALDIFGLPAVVTIPAGAPTASTIIWLSPVSVETAGVIVPTDNPQRALALPRADFPAVPRGTVIEAAEIEGAAASLWMVEAILTVLPDEIRVVVIPAEAP